MRRRLHEQDRLALNIGPFTSRADDSPFLLTVRCVDPEAAYSLEVGAGDGPLVECAVGLKMLAMFLHTKTYKMYLVGGRAIGLTLLVAP